MSGRRATMMLAAPTLNDSERNLGRIIKLTCLLIIACAIVYQAMDRLESILIPFMLALAISYLLTPLIECLSCKNVKSCCCRLPHFVAVLIAILIACVMLSTIGIVLVQAVTTFKSRTALYRERLEELLEAGFSMAATLQVQLGGEASTPIHNTTEEAGVHDHIGEVSGMISGFLKDISLTDLLLQLLGTAAHVLEDLMYIVLFLIFLLIHPSAADDTAEHSVGNKVNRQIFVYIRGKGAISAYVGCSHAAVLWYIGLDLWVPFGVLTFCLNFIPNVGGMGAVCLPMPLIALDPLFDGWKSAVAFGVPFLNNIFAKDVLEPTVLGQSTSLHPVAVLLAILLYGSVWGITGMVMAIPLTAVLRIYLASINHPLPRAVAAFLAGGAAHGHVAPVEEDTPPAPGDGKTQEML